MRETKLKQSEVGLIPYNWKIAKISDISTIVTGATPSTEVKTYWEGGTIRWMSSGELNNKQIYEVANQITQDGYEHSGTHMIPPLCVLIGLAGQGKTRGTAAINYVELCTNQSIAAILPNQLIFDSKYLYYYIDSQYESLRLLSAGDGGRGGLNKQTLLNVHVPLPASKLEQERIAKALSDMDGLLDSLTKLIDKKRNIKTAAMQQLLTGKKRLKGFSEHWVELKLGDLVRITMGQSPDSIYYNHEKKGLPLIQGNADIENRKQIIRMYTSQITKECDEGDIIMSVRAPVGAIGKASEKSCIGRGVCAIKYENDYIYHLLIFSENKWSEFSKGSTFDSVTSKELFNFEIFVPSSKSEQTAIATILSDMDAEISALEQKRAKYESIKKGMMQQLLTGRIRLV